MKAIRTHYLGATNYRPSRIVASDEDGHRITISYQSELGTSDAHRRGADALCAKMGWQGEMIEGSMGNGFVFVFTKGDIRRQPNAEAQALVRIQSELGVPGEGYPANVANAYRIADEALERAFA